jgi:hypothetical protein
MRQRIFRYYRFLTIQILHPKWPELPNGQGINVNPVFLYNPIASQVQGETPDRVDYIQLFWPALS